MDFSEDLTVTNGGSIVFDRIIGSLGAAISPNDYFETKEGHEYNDGWEESSSVELTGWSNLNTEGPDIPW